MKNFSMLDEKEKKKRTWIKRIFILVGIILIVDWQIFLLLQAIFVEIYSILKIIRFYLEFAKTYTEKV